MAQNGTNNGVASAPAEEFKLSKLIKVHRDAVRDMALYEDFADAPKLVTVSRDGDAKIFSVICGTVIDRPELTISDGCPMSCVTTAPKFGATVPLLFFGCLNGAIFVHLDKEATPLNVLTFHSANVCALRVDSQERLLATGSWDNTSIVYDIAGEAVRFRILSHSQSVNDVVFLRPPVAGGRLCLLTASSDKSIVLWDISSRENSSVSPPQLHSYMGHEDCVRGLLLVPELDSFWSVSNDQTIKCWSLTSGEQSATLVGHLHFIYRISPLKKPPGAFMTAGEDKTLRIWSPTTGTELQTIHLPVVSIWNAIALTESTIVVAASDGRLYLLSTDPSMAATPDQMSQLEALYAKQNVIPFEEVVHLKLYEASSLEAIPAKVGGEKRLIRSIEDDSVSLFEADKEGKNWAPVGSIKEYVHSEQVDEKTGKVFFNGEYFDDVISLTLHGLNYRFPANRNLDPWLVAADLAAQHHLLEPGDLQAIAKALVTGLKWTPKQAKVGDVFADVSEFPMSVPILFDAPPNWEKFKAKFTEFHAGIVNEELKLSEAQWAVVVANFNEPGSSSDVFVGCYEKLLKWPNNLRFLVYDLLRLNLANPYFSSYLLHHMTSFREGFFEELLAQTKVKELALQLTAIRCLTNLFSTVHGGEFMYSKLELLSAIVVPWTGLVANRNVQLAYATLWFNYSVLLVDKSKVSDSQLIDLLLRKVLEADQVKELPGEAAATMMNVFGNLLAAGGKHWREEKEEVKEHLRKVQSYPKTYGEASGVRSALVQINRL